MFFQALNFVDKPFSLAQCRIMNEPIALVPGKSDAEIAADFRKRVIELYEPLLELLTEANNKGFVMNVQCGLDGLGRIAILQLQISKVFK